jgi:Family of unknown function (DUF695)
MKNQEFKIIDDWSVGRVDNPSSPVIIRLRSKLNSIIGKDIFPHLLQLSWSFQDMRDAGMPSRSELNELSSFEDIMRDVFETDLHSVLTIIITKKGVREWFFYTASVDEFMNRLASVPHSNKNPIQVLFTENESWKYYDSLMNNVC